MVNGSSGTAQAERRERPRAEVAEAAPFALGHASLNPFGDLATVQHLSARLAKALAPVMEPLLHKELRSWAEPVSVQRLADYRAERGEALSAWTPLAMSPVQGRALLVLDGRFVMELLDLFFGGNGHAPANLPEEFAPSALALVERIAALVADPVKAAWAPIAHLGFKPASADHNPANFTGYDGEEAMIVTRIGLAAGDGHPAFIDLLYPVATLKPHTPSLTGKAMQRATAPDPAWRNGLTRAVMGVSLPVRSVLAQPSMQLGKLMDLKVGDIIPIDIDPEVTVLIGKDKLATGTVGTANGHAAVKINALAHIHEEEVQ